MDGKTCFVIMPFGKKKDASGEEINFDLVYADVIVESIRNAGLEPVRCDGIEEAGAIHEDMFEQIAQADAAVVDITNLNANVFYELGARHALRDHVTVLIRKRGGSVPFNIQDLRVVDYPSETGSYAESRRQITQFIRTGLATGKNDSPITPILKRLREEDDGSRPIKELLSFAYALTDNPAKQIEIRTGDIRKWRGVDVWVNSENTNMQMARFFDRNLSAVIRYHGAKKDENNEIDEDTIAIELQKAVKGRKSVTLGTVYATGAGALEGTHDVKRIFHVASVVGVPGEGYRADVSIIDTCVSRCLRRLDSEGAKGAALRSIAFPMIGTGAGGGDVGEVARILIESALHYLRDTPDSVIEKVVFMAWNRRDLEACQSACQQLPGIQPKEGGGAV